MPPEVWGAIGIVITALIGLLGIRATARQSARATEITAAPESRRVDIEGFTALVESLQDERTALINERAENAKERAELVRRVESLEAWREQQHRILRTHEAWDVEVVARLRSNHIIMADPPPLRSVP